MPASLLLRISFPPVTRIAFGVCYGVCVCVCVWMCVCVHDRVMIRDRELMVDVGVELWTRMEQESTFGQRCAQEEVKVNGR